MGVYFITNNLLWIYFYFGLVRFVIFREELLEYLNKIIDINIDNINFFKCLVLPHLRLRIDNNTLHVHIHANNSQR